MSMDAADGSRRVAGHAVAGAATGTLAAALPVFLLGGLAVQVGADLGFGPGLLGLLVSGYFTASALAAAPAGRLAEAVGPRRSVRAGAVLAVVALVGVAVLARSAAVLAVLLLVAGVANALVQLGANGSLARAVPRPRQGTAFAVKQVAVPASSLLAGLAVPALALTVGWRWAFALAALVAVAATALSVPDGPAPATAAPAPSAGGSRPSPRGLGRLAVAGGLGAAAAGALTTFLVASAVEAGASAGPAGLLLAFGSALGVAARLTAGVLVDRLARRTPAERLGDAALRGVALQLGSGAVGFALLLLASATGSAVALVAGTAVAFAGGWSWPGVLNAAVVRLVPSAPSAATGVTQTGVFAGAASGPLVAGLLVEVAGYPAAWTAAGAAQALACVLLLRRAPTASPPGRGTVAPAASDAAAEEVP